MAKERHLLKMTDLPCFMDTDGNYLVIAYIIKSAAHWTPGQNTAILCRVPVEFKTLRGRLLSRIKTLRNTDAGPVQNGSLMR